MVDQVVDGSPGHGRTRHGEERLAALRQGPHAAHVLVLDLRDRFSRGRDIPVEELEIRALFDFAESRFGGVDVLVNNASSPDGLGQLTGWVESIQTELLGPMRATLLAIEAMRRRGGGAIVNIGSTSALGHGRKHSRWPSYDAGKMAVMRLTTTLGPLRDQENIRVNCLVPSWVASPGPKEYWASLTPAQRKERGVPETLNQLDEIADTILRLATDESLFGRIMVWWNGEPPRLIPVGDPGYQRLE